MTEREALKVEAELRRAAKAAKRERIEKWLRMNPGETDTTASEALGVPRPEISKIRRAMKGASNAAP